MSALVYATQLLGALPALLEVGANVMGLITTGSARLQQMASEGRDPTAEEWDELNARIAALRGELHGE